MFIIDSSFIIRAMKILSKEDYLSIQKFAKLADYNEYNSNLVTMVMWSHVYEISCEVHPNYVILLVNYHHNLAWLMPLCAPQYRREAMETMKTYSEAHHFPFEVHGMTQEFKDYCEANQLHFVYHDDYDARDYVYEIEMHKTLVGKKMQKRRNHYNNFIGEYENRYFFKPLEESDFVNVLAFVDEWKSKHEDPESIETERIGIQRILDQFSQLNLSGGCLYIDNKLEAFCITSSLSEDTIQMHVEKANHEIRGLYVALLKNTLMQFDPKYRYINREDDLGIESLRKAKMDLHPVKRIKKYIAYYGKTTIIKATDEYTFKIKKLWFDAFNEETIESTDFYFKHLYKPEETLLLVHERQVICMLQVKKLKIMKNHELIETGLILGVATHKYYQRCGYMKQLMDYYLAHQSYPFLGIQAYNWDLYKPFGFSEAYTLKQTLVQANGSVSLIKQCEDASKLLALYEQYTLRFDGYRIRDLAYYQDYFIPYAHMDSEIYANQGAYIVIDREHTEIRECIYTNDNDLWSLIHMFTGPINVFSDIGLELTKESTIINEMMIRGAFERNQALFINEIM